MCLCWLCMCCPCCCVGFLQLLHAGAAHLCSVWASPCRAALVEHGLLGAGTSGVAACGLSECGPRVLEHRLRRCSWPQGDLLGGMWDLLGSGIKPVSPALAVWILSH